MKNMETKKKTKYLKRVLNDENGTFTPLVFTSNGGMSKETRRFYIRLAELIADKSKNSYSETSAWIKRRLSFSLIEIPWSDQIQRDVHPWIEIKKVPMPTFSERSGHE